MKNVQQTFQRWLITGAVVVFGYTSAFAQSLGVNNPTPDASSVLDVAATDRGVLFPRMTTAQKTGITSPAAGLLVYDTDLDVFYYYDATAAAWTPLLSGSSSSGWSTLGNSGTTPATNFLGTIDAVDFRIRTNNTERMSILAGGNVGIGTMAPSHPFNMVGGGNAISGTSVAVANLSTVFRRASNDNGQALGIGFGHSTATSTLGGAIIFERTGGWSQGSMHFATKASTSDDPTIPIRMTLSAAGRLGIGTTDPAAMAQVQSLVDPLSGTGTWANYPLFLYNNANANGVGTGIAFANTATANNVGASIIFNRTGAFSQGELQFYTKRSATDGAVPEQAMVINNTGNVGVGANAPQRSLHVSRFANNLLMLQSTVGGNGNTANMDFMTYDAGLPVYPTARISAVDNNWSSHITFLTKVPGDNANGLAERVRITNAGNLGVGTVAPGYLLQVGDAGDGSEARANAWNLLSDIRLKTNIAPISSPLTKIRRLNGVYFDWKSTGKRSIGFIAQEVQKVLPEIVSESPEDGYLSMEYSNITALLIEGMKEQQDLIEAQQEEIASLSARLSAIEAALQKAPREQQGAPENVTAEEAGATRYTVK